MSSKIDFYDGRGPAARWLGSLQHDCHPEQLLAHPTGLRALTATDPITFSDEVTTLLDQWPGMAYYPADGWPWPWPDSHVTDWICAFEHGRVWLAIGAGCRWHRLDPEHPTLPDYEHFTTHEIGPAPPLGLPTMRRTSHTFASQTQFRNGQDRRPTVMTTTNHSNADFYAGLGLDAVWIGSLGAHADPVRLATGTLPGGRALLTATSETDYRAAFDELARHWDDQCLGVVYRPQGEWPMTWVSPALVGYRYALAEGRVWISGPDDAGRWWTTTRRPGPDDRPATRTEIHHHFGIPVGIPRDPDTTAAHGCYHQHHSRAADAVSEAVRACFARDPDVGTLTRAQLGELIADLGVPGVADHVAFPHHQERALSALRALHTGMFYATPGNNPHYATTLANHADSMAHQALIAAEATSPL